MSDRTHFVDPHAEAAIRADERERVACEVDAQYVRGRSDSYIEGYMDAVDVIARRIRAGGPAEADSP